MAAPILWKRFLILFFCPKAVLRPVPERTKTQAETEKSQFFVLLRHFSFGCLMKFFSILLHTC